jgi:hypothetical protein
MPHLLGNTLNSLWDWVLNSINMFWSKKYPSCVSCATDEWAHKSRGYCIKCYPLIKKKAIIQKWDQGNPSTLVPVKPCSKEMLQILVKSGRLDLIKGRLLEQIDLRLNKYKFYNTPRFCTGLIIEHYLEQIASLTNNVSDRPLFHGAVDRYSVNFNAEQREIIYKDLLYILIHRRFNLLLDLR